MKRVNTKTGKPFKLGDKRPDGYVFTYYDLDRKTLDGYFKERWFSPEKYFKNRVYKKYVDSKRTRNRQPGFEKLKNELSVDYLLSIFPADHRCPVFGFKMEFGGNWVSSPSLDRINPKEGYTKENTVWISFLANKMKSNLNLEELVQMRDWAKKIS